MRHALLAPFPELASIAGPWLEHSIGGRPSHGIPPHVTVLAPSPEDIGQALDVEFLPDITPHLTVAWGAKLDEAEAAVASRLPIHARAREVVLFARAEPERWIPATRFPLAGA